MAKKRPYENYRYKHYDSWLLNYAWIDEKIKRRKLEIETTHSNDINVGGRTV